jgi:hypothetical protein
MDMVQSLLETLFSYQRIEEKAMLTACPSTITRGY